MRDTEDVQAWAAEQAEDYRRLEPETWAQRQRAEWEAQKAEWAASGAELVYTHHEGMWGIVGSIPHRMVKKTAARLYVSREIFTPVYPKTGRTWQEHERQYGVRTFILDRVALERDGKVTCRAAHYQTYYLRPFEDKAEWAEDVERTAQMLQRRTDPEGWVEHRRRVDEYMGRPWGVRA
jgi:hypothetical protein